MSNTIRNEHYIVVISQKLVHRLFGISHTFHPMLARFQTLRAAGYGPEFLYLYT